MTGRKRTTIIALSALIVGSGAVGFYAWVSRRAELNASPTAHGPWGVVSFNLEADTVRPGESVVLIADFSGAYGLGFGPLAASGVQVFDRDGVDLLRIRDGAVNTSASNAGFEYQGVEVHSCGLPITSSQPPSTLRFTDRLEFRILPETPSGGYSIRVGRGAFCNGLPVAPAELRFQVASAS